MDKRVIRQQLLKHRKQLDEVECRSLSLQIQRRLIESDFFCRAGTLALYSSVNNEVGTDQLWRVALSKGKRICFPRVSGDMLQFVAVKSAAELQPGAFGVAEPKGGESLASAEIDILVVPGVAFDRNGFRLGYGKGFYDRKLARLGRNTLKVGLCYDFQLCEPLPVEAHDQQLDYVATETQLIPCHSDLTGSP